MPPSRMKKSIRSTSDGNSDRDKDTNSKRSRLSPNDEQVQMNSLATSQVTANSDSRKTVPSIPTITPDPKTGCIS